MEVVMDFPTSNSVSKRPSESLWRWVMMTGSVKVGPKRWGGGFTTLKINILHIITEVWKIIFLSNGVICRFHVNLPGCTFCIS